jgi:hypothetical protein
VPIFLFADRFRNALAPLRVSMRYVTSLAESGDQNTAGRCFASWVPWLTMGRSEGISVA